MTESVKIAEQGRPGGTAILAELKRELKRQGVGVPQLAERFGVAEPTLRRWLRGQGLTLDNLDRLCQLLGLDLRDVATRAHSGGADVFTLAQERILAADRGLGLLFFAILNGAQRDRLEEDFKIPAARVGAHLDRLRRLALIDISPSGRIRPLVSRLVRWSPGGPLAIAFEHTVKSFFLAMDFGAAEARYESDMVRLSEAGRSRVHALFAALREDIHLIAAQDGAARFGPYEWSAVLMLVRPLEINDVTRDLR
jgi:transcriptional regulator with XRE-family HTH domain